MKQNIVTQPPTRLHERADISGTLLADVVRRIRADAHRLSATDQQLLSDLARGQYKTTWLSRLLDIAARCETDAGAYALVEALTAQIAARRAQHALPLAEAIRAEDAAEADENRAIREYTFTRTAAAAQLAGERAALHELSLARLRASLAVVAGGSFQ